MHHLRTLDDADRLREGFAAGSRLAIVGAGLIGAEVASTALGHGITPTLIETARAPLRRAFGCAIGALLAERWRVAGADVRTDARVLRRTPGPARRDIAQIRRRDLPRVRSDPRRDRRRPGHEPRGLPVEPRRRRRHLYRCLRQDQRSRRLRVRGRRELASPGHRRPACERRTGRAPRIRPRSWRAPSWASRRPPSDVPLYAWSDQFGLRLQHVQHRRTLAARRDRARSRRLRGPLSRSRGARRRRRSWPIDREWPPRLRRELAALPVAA